MEYKDLNSERLCFRNYSKDDYHDLIALFCDNKKVMSSTLSGQLLTKNQLNSLIQNDFRQRTDTPFGFVTVHEKNSGHFIGISGIFQCDYLNQDDIEFGFILDDKYWGRGYATEIGGFWIDFVFSKLYKNRILATTSPENQISQKVLEKLGLTVHSSINIDQRGNRLVYVKNR